MINTENLTEIYNELLSAGVLVSSGSYHLKDDCDSIIVSDGVHYGIFLDIDKIRTVAQEAEAVSHEWAHYHTGATYTFAAPPAVKQKAEARADRAQIEKLLPFEEMRGAIRAGRSQIFELAEYFTVSEEMIRSAISYYTGPKGLRFE